MHVLIIPSERYLPDKNSLEGIFQKDQAEVLNESGLRVGVISIELYGIKKILKEKIFFFSDKMICSEEQNINVCRIRVFSPHSRFLKVYSKIWIWKGKKIFKEYIKKYGTPDIIHAHNVLYAGMLALELSNKYSIPYVITEHSSQFINKKFTDFEIKKIQKAYKSANRLISVSKNLKMEINKVTSINDFLIIPNVLNKIFEYNESLEIRKEKRELYFFSLAALVMNKGFYELIQSFATSFKGDKTKKLVIGGDGPERKSLQKYVNDLHITDQVEFTGVLSKQEVKNRMQQCDIFVLASHYETFGVVYIEAMSCGKPVIATQCGGPEYIVNTTNGILIKPKDLNGLSDALTSMSKNYLNYDSNKIKNDCISQYGSNKFVSSLYKLYEEILEENIS